MRKILSLISLFCFAFIGLNAQIVNRRLPAINLTDPANNNVRINKNVSSKHKIGTLESAPMIANGSPKIPVILVEFADTKFTLAGSKVADALKSASATERSGIINDLYNNYYNGRKFRDHGSAGSLFDYYAFQSDSIFQPQFEIIGPVCLDKSYAYYGESEYDNKIQEFYSQACTYAATQNPNLDWKSFDNNSDGMVDFVFFVYAGEGENAHCDPQADDYDPNLIWPKESTSTLKVYTEKETISFASFGCTCETYHNSLDGIGLPIHEFGHALGFPDFYDTVSSVGFGMDVWDIMDAGCYQASGKQPCSMTAYELDFLNWRKIEDVSTDEEVAITLKPMDKKGSAVLVRNPANPYEYYILENRQNNNWNLYLGWTLVSYYKSYGPNHGMMITHVDYRLDAWTSNSVNIQQKHQRMTIVPADNNLYSGMYGYDNNWVESIRGDLYPGSHDVHQLLYTDASAYTACTSLSGETINSIGYSFLNIEESEDGTITLTVRRAGYVPTSITSVSPSVNNSKTYNLQGIEVNTPQRGMYIRDGKKYIVK